MAVIGTAAAGMRAAVIHRYGGPPEFRTETVTDGERQPSMQRNGR